MLFAEANVTNGANAFNLTKKTYGIGDSIEGYINISLSAQSADSNLRLIINNKEQNISLLDFLVKSGLRAGNNFLCNPKSCEQTYQTISESSKSKRIKGGRTIVGAMITGNSIEFKTNVLEFDVSGENSTPSCGVSPLRIDLLADKSNDWQYLEGDDFCGALLPSACYDDENANKNFDVTNTGYCQKIFLPVSTRFKLSALVKKNKGEGDLKLFLYDKKTGNSESCDLEEPNETAYIQKNCTVNFPISSYYEEQEYYICIRDELSDNSYTIKGEMTEPLCGTGGLPDGNATADFGLFVQPSSIVSFNRTIRFNDTEFSKTHIESLAEYIKDYITEKYDGDCISGCLIPIEIMSEQDVTIDNFAVRYCTQGLCTTENNFFELTKKPALIDMNFTSISLEAANFTALGQGNQTATFFIGDSSIGSEQIMIERIPVIKEIIQAGKEAMSPIQFIVDVYSPKNNSLVSYQWDFGDGSTEKTLLNTTTHSYGNVGTFKLKVEVTDSEGLIGTKTKEIIVGSPKEVLNKTLVIKRAFLSNITVQIENAGWYKDLLTKEIGTAEISDKLSEYERQYKLAATDAEYLDIMTKLKELNMPQVIYDAETVTNMPLITDVDTIMPEYIEKLNGGTYDTNYATETKNAVGDWNSKNLQLSISSKIVDLVKEDNSREDVITVINLNIEPNEQKRELFFVIVLPYERTKFAAEYGQQQLDGAIGFLFKDTTEQNINFAVPGRIDVENLVAFGSPYLGDLEIVPPEIVCNNNGKCEKGENWKNCRSDCKPIGLAIFYILLVAVLIYTFYLFLQKWYKTKYESYLFKNRQDLHNLLFFIGNSFKKGKQEKEIIEELKKAGWGSEQINYALRKVRGERIGMPEIRIKIKGIKLMKSKSTPKV